jgi:hypothetical protein
LMSNSKKQRRGDHHKVLKVSENSAHSSVIGQLDTEHVVKTLSLDQAVEQLQLPVPDYMKIDIDGSEVAFFKGAVNTLADPKLKGFMIELYKESLFYSRLLQTLADANFELKAEFQIASAGQLDPGLFNMEYVRRDRDHETLSDSSLDAHRPKNAAVTQIEMKSPRPVRASQLDTSLLSREYRRIDAHSPSR